MSKEDRTFKQIAADCTDEPVDHVGVTLTTTEDFNIFQLEAVKWLGYFGLKGWRIFWKHEKLDADFAQVRYNILARNAVFVLNTEFDTCDYSEDQIRSSAFHEVCELLLVRLSDMGKMRFITEVEIDEEVHNLIRIFENTIFKDNAQN